MTHPERRLDQAPLGAEHETFQQRRMAAALATLDQDWTDSEGRVFSMEKLYATILFTCAWH